MISRRSASKIGEVYAVQFGYLSSTCWYVHHDQLYDFLFECDYPPWFCNRTKGLNSTRDLKEFIMRLHTGETQAPVTTNWTIQQREKLGQEYLRDLAEDILTLKDNSLVYGNHRRDLREAVRSSLELDGYVFQNSRLLAPEADILDTAEEAGVLDHLFTALGLANKDTAFHCLKLSEDNWIAQHWDDCISQARRFLESTLQEVAAAHSLRFRNTPLPTKQYEKPFEVRDYLECTGLLEAKEKKAIAEIYGLLSNTGSHPYIAEKDQARLLRQVALLFSQFVMLRFDGLLRAGMGAT